MTREESVTILAQFWNERLIPAGAKRDRDKDIPVYYGATDRVATGKALEDARAAALAAATVEELRRVDEAIAVRFHGRPDAVAAVRHHVIAELTRRGITP